MTASARRGAPDRSLAVVVALLATFTVVRTAAVPGDGHFAGNVAMIAVVVAMARAARLSFTELGLARADLIAGFRLGVLAFVTIGVVAAGALAVLGAEPFLESADLGRGVGEIVYLALVRIPVGTVLLEELAFRGVLLALLLRRFRPLPAVAANVALFALWHVPSVVGDAGGLAGALAGTLVATAAAGIAFAWLRLRSGSLLAPMLAHLGTNALTLALAWAAGPG